MNAPIALLFDFNGTLVNDTDCHLQAWLQVLQQHGATLSLTDMRQQWYGKNEEIVERILPNRFSSGEKLAISLQKEKVYLSTFNKQVVPVQGLTDFLDAAADLHIPMAVGSAATPTTLNTLLKHLNIAHYFTATVSANEVTNSKPHPETYCLCAKKLQMSPKQCIVFEDAPKGAEAAAAADMPCIALTTTHPPEAFTRLHNILHYIPDYQHEWLWQWLASYK